MARSMKATVSSKGQVTIPLAVRQRLGIRTGDRLFFVIGDDGRVHVEREPRHTLDELIGILGRPPGSVTVTAMDKAIRAHASKRARRG
jgi:AbrB family looped-hinge helix DNA binding protein